MVSLAELIDSGYVQTDRPYELKYQLLRTAADLGHQRAQLQIREEEEKLSPAQRQAAPRIMMDFLGVRCSGVWFKFCSDRWPHGFGHLVMMSSAFRFVRWCCAYGAEQRVGI